MAAEYSQGMHQQPDLRQEQTISTAQIQSLNILLTPAVELRSIIEQALVENPVLEVEEPDYEPLPETGASGKEEAEDTDDALRAVLEYTAAGGEPQDLGFPPDQAQSIQEWRDQLFESLTDHESMQTHLMNQLQLMELDEKTFRIGEAIIGSIEDTGYLTTHLADIAMSELCSMEEAERVLKLIQSFDPPGIGARDLKECLLLQIAPENPNAEDLKLLIMNHLEEIGKGNLQTIAKAMELPEENVLMLIREIRNLNPFPGGTVAVHDSQYITPEAEIVPDGDGFKVIVPERDLPRLRLSQYYLDMLEDPETQEIAKKYLREKIRDARQLMDSLEKRKSTIGRIAEHIVTEQFDFLKEGISCLRPMTMKLIADKLGLKESTISRAVSGKYVKTPQGVFEFKYFFTSGFVAEDGSAISSRSVKEQIRDLIDGEDSAKPLSDSKLADLLVKQGIEISRRTVAKYREEMKIPASHERKAVF